MKPENQGDRPIILAVDDMSINLRSIKLALGDGYDVRVAKSGYMALSILESLKVDLILLDIEMPEMSGFDFMGQLAGGNWEQKPPVILVTAHVSPEMLARAKMAGAVGYIIKPYDAAVLITKVNEALASKAGA